MFIQETAVSVSNATELWGSSEPLQWKRLCLFSLLLSANLRVTTERTKFLSLISPGKAQAEQRQALKRLRNRTTEPQRRLHLTAGCQMLAGGEFRRTQVSASWETLTAASHGHKNLREMSTAEKPQMRLKKYVIYQGKHHTLMILCCSLRETPLLDIQTHPQIFKVTLDSIEERANSCFCGEGRKDLSKRWEGELMKVDLYTSLK